MLFPLLCWAAPSLATTFSGSLETKQEAVVAFCTLNAQKMGSEESVQFQTSRSGGFSVELTEGTWTVTADVTQIEAWGFSQLEGITVPMTGSTPASMKIILHASQPLRIPTLKFNRTAGGTMSFVVNGQGGTRVTIYSSTDMKNWTSYYSRPITTTGYSYSVTNKSDRHRKRYFKASASTD